MVGFTSLSRLELSQLKWMASMSVYEHERSLLRDAQHTPPRVPNARHNSSPRLARAPRTPCFIAPPCLANYRQRSNLSGQTHRSSWLHSGLPSRFLRTSEWLSLVACSTLKPGFGYRSASMKAARCGSFSRVSRSGGSLILP